MTWAYFYVFLQSNLLEVPFYYWLLRHLKRPAPILPLVTGINSLTHPVVFFVIMNLQMTYLQNILFAESFAIVSEGIFFSMILQTEGSRRAAHWRQCFLASLVANFISWQFAPALTYLALQF